MKTELLRCLSAAGVLLVAVGSPAPVSATIPSQTDATSTCGPENDSKVSYTGSPVRADCSYFSERAYGMASTFTSEGVMRAGALGSADFPSITTGNSVVVRAYAQLFDTVTFDSAGLTGRPGRASTTVTVDGFARAVANGTGTVDAIGGGGLRVGSSTYLRMTGQRIVTRSDGSQDERLTLMAVDNGVFVPYSNTIAVSWDFVFGTPFEISGSLDALATVVGHGLAEAAFDHSWHWNGIQSLTFEGAAVPYTLTSESGTDWSRSFATPVPEPASTALFPLGLLIVGAAARMRSWRR